MTPALPVLDARSAWATQLSPATAATADDGARPHVVAWNLTRRCNLACAHCYIAAGSWHAAANELTTDECRRIADEIFDVVDAPIFILSGGEPLLRDDLEDIARHAADRGATVVVGTNGTRLTDARIASLQEAGVTGVAISIDSLDARYHDRFRHGDNALDDTLAAVERVRAHRLDFVVQTTVTRGNRAEIPALAAWAAERGAVSFNTYFLVPTGRADAMRGLAPAENEAVLAELAALERTYRGRMLVRSKCQPQIMRHVHASDPESPLLNYATRCPCGVSYCRITPEGKLTPCPYMPLVAGDLREKSFAELWRASPVFRQLRTGDLGGRCGRCEYRQLCGGCRARAYADTGDPLAEDASCVYEPVPGAAVLGAQRAVTYGTATDATMPWSDDARARIARVPGFVRGVVTARVESFARERGYTEVTAAVMAEVRKNMPVDFSRRLPFFMRETE
jgi:radical SAM protein with 4Fe4S-binding SPASM domain